MSRSRFLGALIAAPLAFASSSAHSVASATFAFDYVTDPVDIADGPDYDVTGVGLVDDTGLSCDAVTMVMVDPTGTPVDVDSFCISVLGGTGGSDGDYGSFETAYLPVSGPVTYALFDLTPTDLANLTGLGDAERAYFDYVIANCTLLAEATLPVQALVSVAPFSFGGAFGGAGSQCYSAKDLKNPKFVPVDALSLADAFGTSTVQVKKPFYVCSQAGVGGDPAPASDSPVCCYKTKGTKLSPAAEVQTEDQFGLLQQRVQTPKLFCTPCARSAIPAP